MIRLARHRVIRYRSAMSPTAESIAAFPRPLADYPTVGESLLRTLGARIELEPFNIIATGILVLAIIHTFSAARFGALAHQIQQRHDEKARALGRTSAPSVLAEVLHFFGEVEVVFGLWAVVLTGRHHRVARLGYRRRTT